MREQRSVIQLTRLLRIRYYIPTVMHYKGSKRMLQKYLRVADVLRSSKFSIITHIIHDV